MSDMTTPDLLKLVEELFLPFHQIKRNHRLPRGPWRHETDVEHSWIVGVLACSMAPHIDPQLELGKISQYASVHDLVEVYAGDTSLFTSSAKHHASKAEREQASLARIRQEHPAFPWIADTIAEYESFASDEAKYVYAVDKYIALMYDLIDEGRTLIKHGVTHERYEIVRTEHRRKAHLDPRVGKYYDEILAIIHEHPEYFAR
ncbi:MAG: Metal dependent phosphohydrolase [Candidatus Saccharibacteria bacterium]|jgi:5'-deoxynucleotidase YfbR-like HD superfamily hydrolase|nr:Metal dependent phosphohydrolase [Candidatus Saccharibacteria bacterium]